MKTIFLKLLAFLAILIGIGMLLMMIFAANATLVGIIMIITVSIGALAVADLAVFFIVLICGDEKTRNKWKSFFSLMIASVAVLLIGVIFNAFIPSIPLVVRMSYGLSIMSFIASIVNLVYNISCLLFGTEKLSIPWKLCFFFLILTGVFTIIYIFSDFLNEVFLSESVAFTTISHILLSVSILLAIASLLAAIVNGIYHKKSINSLFKLFISLIIISASIFATSWLFYFVYESWRNIMLYSSGVVLFVGVAVLIVLVFRSIFMNKPFAKNENYQNVATDYTIESVSVTDSTDNAISNNATDDNI